jgi:hypothetical protein
VREIRQAYRDLSKLYHPDTTNLSAAIATAKFQQLNEAYATLSSPERRSVYDQKIGYSRVTVVQPLPGLGRSSTQTKYDPSASAYLDPTDRPLSAGEIFALFILGLTFLACLTLAIAIGITRGESVVQPIAEKTPSIQTVNLAHPKPPIAKSAPARVVLPKPSSVAAPSVLHSPSVREPKPSLPPMAPIHLPILEKPMPPKGTIEVVKDQLKMDLSRTAPPESKSAPSLPIQSSSLSTAPAGSSSSPFDPGFSSSPPARLHDTPSL